MTSYVKQALAFLWNDPAKPQPKLFADLTDSQLIMLALSRSHNLSFGEDIRIEMKRRCEPPKPKERHRTTIAGYDHLKCKECGNFIKAGPMTAPIWKTVLVESDWCNCDNAAKETP